MKEFIEKLIGRLEELYNNNDKMKKKAYEEQDWENFELFTYGNEGVKESIEIVNQLAEEYNKEHDDTDYANIELYNFWLNHQWIDCEEQLPEEYKDVLGCDCEGNIIVVRLYTDTVFGKLWKLWNGGDWKFNCIVAWQPLPEPYQPKGE